MNVISDIEQIRAQVKQWRGKQNTIALVPTMGHLHAGHLSLITLAQSRTQRVIVTIFINPLQFNDAEDLAHYPRSLTADLKQLQKLNVDVVFTPQETDIYPYGIEQCPRIHIPKLSEEFCGRYRPGHFAGVCTIVAKLFNIVTPDIAVFGKKDYQQLLLIKRMAQELNYTVEIIAGDTIREPDGLALSSRNIHLSQKHRAVAPKLYQTLQEISQDFAFDRLDQLEASSQQALSQFGFKCEYLAIRDAKDLSPIKKNTKMFVVLTAAWLGSTRLIDNLLFPQS